MRTKQVLIKKSNLRNILKRRNMTAYRLAKLLKVQPIIITKWCESVTPTAHYCAKIMSLLDCTIWDLLHTYGEGELDLDEDLEEDTKRELAREQDELNGR